MTKNYNIYPYNRADFQKINNLIKLPFQSINWLYKQIRKQFILTPVLLILSCGTEKIVIEKEKVVEADPECMTIYSTPDLNCNFEDRVSDWLVMHGDYGYNLRIWYYEGPYINSNSYRYAYDQIVEHDKEYREYFRGIKDSVTIKADYCDQELTVMADGI